jgi:hypothetical protein
VLKNLSESFDKLRTNGEETSNDRKTPFMLTPRQARD